MHVQLNHTYIHRRFAIKEKNHCFPSVSAFPRPCFPCLPHQLVSQFVSIPVSFLGWFVRLPEVLSALPPSLSSSLSFRLSPSLSSFLFPFVGWCVGLPEVLSPLSPSVSSQLVSIPVSFLQCFFRLPEVLSPLSPSLSSGLSSSLSPRLSPSLSSFLFPFVGWCVRLPEALSPSLSLPSLPAKMIARQELRKL